MPKIVEGMLAAMMFIASGFVLLVVIGTVAAVMLNAGYNAGQTALACSVVAFFAGRAAGKAERHG